ncbi:MAG: hypothetical protein KA168_07305, partial [Chitinophagales bacterium]|nr:hypothetical protein [Chitinophagales bacterium]
FQKHAKISRNFRETLPEIWSLSNTIKIKYEFAALPFAQKPQKNVSLFWGLKQGILTPTGWHDYRK